MGFLFGGGGGGPSEEETRRQQEAEERTQAQEEKVERQERQEKTKISARKRAIRRGGTMSQLVSQDRTDPMLGNPTMPEEQMKLGRNPR